MSHPIESIAKEADTTRRNIFIVVAVITALLIAGLVYLITRPKQNAGQQQPQLEGALRAGSPEFDQSIGRIIVEFNPDEDATEATRPLGDIVMQMTPTVRNFTGRTITGLEMRAAVVDLENNPVKERTVIAIPERQPELEPNKVMKVPIIMEGFKKTDTRANIRIQVTGVKFK